MLFPLLGQLIDENMGGLVCHYIVMLLLQYFSWHTAIKLQMTAAILKGALSSLDTVNSPTRMDLNPLRNFREFEFWNEWIKFPFFFIRAAPTQTHTVTARVASIQQVATNSGSAQIGGWKSPFEAWKWDCGVGK